MRTVLDYVLEQPIRVGRSTTVHRARRLPGDQRVALKLATVGLPSGELATVQLRLRREATALAAVTHPGVVPLVEVLDVPAARGRLHRHGSPPTPPTEVAIVLAWARLGSLADALAGGPIGGADAIAMAHQLAGALAAVHAAGFVHGDLSPGNVLRADRATWWLADLGEARPPAAAPRVPRRGTDGFVAPEVLDGAPVDRAADVFALGSVIGAAIGTAPGTDGPGTDDPATRSLREVAGRATAGDPARRPAAADLERMVTALDSADRPPPPGPDRSRPARSTPAETAAPAETRELAGPIVVLPAPGPTRPAARPRTTRRTVGLVAGPVAIVAAVVGLVVLRSAPGALPTGSSSADAPTASDQVPPEDSVRPGEPREPARSIPPSDRAMCPGSSVEAQPGAVAVLGDPDGIGCTIAVLWWPDRAEADRPDPDGTRHRFAMGRPGDQLLLGDWDGDGRDTPALYDPSSGTVTRFDGWAPSGATLPGAVVTSQAPLGGLARTDRDADPDTISVDPPPA